ncbi:MAG: TolC family protein [Simkaniaceae bacterium]|nr:TolC family protein [Simkaniaceae bacterium]
MKKTMRVWVSLFLIFLLAGCSTFKGATEPYSLAPSAPNKEWTPPPKSVKPVEFSVEDFAALESHKEYSLAELIHVALMNNPQTRVTWDEARSASAEYGQTLGSWFPTLDFNASWQRLKSPFFFGVNNVDDFLYSQEQANLEMNYTILDFGQTRATTQAALMTLYEADWTHNRQLQTTIRTIMNDYYNFLYEQDLLSSKCADLENASLSLDASKERLRTGIGDVADLMQAQTSYLSSKLAVTAQKQSLHNAYTELSKDMGLPPQINLTTQSFPKEVPNVQVDTLENYIEIAKHRRPDFLAKLAEIQSKQENLYYAQRQHLPTVTGDLSAGRTHFDNAGSDYQFTVQVSFNLPIFHGFEITNGVNVAKSNLAKSEAELKKLEVSIMQEISDYSHDVNFASEAMEDAKAFLNSAKTEFDVQLEKYRVGTGTILDVIAAQAAVADASAQYIKSKRDWYSSLANLAYATGCLSTEGDDKI